ncbi:MAG TPA: threonine ammonia-lyase IlvA [Propionicimonas sp.]|nr:threonine ammonia-lyase IlvA [Propionicimonas sp.]HRA05297.1 threonine ammonia-lyase IlvA [Propionicimonas sp.]
MTIDAQAVDAAAQRLAAVITRTPLQLNERLSAATGASVWLKREDLQPVRSYKIRGAYNLVAQLHEDERRAGVICASAGNHAQGVAFACARLGIHGRIFVPATTPRQKRERIVAIGEGSIDLVVTGDSYDDAAAASLAEASQTGASVVPAFDHPHTIAGQGTVAKEIVEQFGHAPDVLVAPVGGGGMISGCLAYLAERHPGTKVIGAEPAGAASMSAALRAGKPVPLDRMDTFVDGAAVRKVGDLTFAHVQRFAPRLVAVPEGRICSEMLALYQTEGIVTEPAGALAAAALGLYQPEVGQNVVVLISGGNNDVSRYSEIVERSLVYEGRKHYFLVNFPQEPGALRRFLDEVLGPDDDITLFEYVKRSNRETGPALVGIELGDPDSFADLLLKMDASPITFEVVAADSPFYRFLV